jgi:hypothetical protein
MTTSSALTGTPGIARSSEATPGPYRLVFGMVFRERLDLQVDDGSKGDSGSPTVTPVWLP